MKTIKFYKTKSFEFTETQWKEYHYPDGTSQLGSWLVTHRVKGDIAIINSKDVYYGYQLHDLPPYPSMTIDSTFDGSGTDAECDDTRFYLRKGTDRQRPIIEDGEQIGVEDYYQPHVTDYFNKNGLTYIKFDDSFAGGGFYLQQQRILNGRKSLDRNNLFYKKPPADLLAVAWL